MQAARQMLAEELAEELEDLAAAALEAGLEAPGHSRHPRLQRSAHEAGRRAAREHLDSLAVL